MAVGGGAAFGGLGLTGSAVLFTVAVIAVAVYVWKRGK